MTKEKQVIVLFDGVCGLCSRWVHFCIPRDSKGLLRFAALQEEVARQLLESRKKLPPGTDSIVVVVESTVYIKSQAVLEILRVLKQPWPWLGKVGSVLPVALLDIFYDLVAKYRYRFFGKTEACYLPTPEERGRFLAVQAEV